MVHKSCEIFCIWYSRMFNGCILLWSTAKRPQLSCNVQQAVRSEFHWQQSCGGWQPYYKQGPWNFHGVCTRNGREVFWTTESFRDSKSNAFCTPVELVWMFVHGPCYHRTCYEMIHGEDQRWIWFRFTLRFIYNSLLINKWALERLSNKNTLVHLWCYPYSLPMW